MIGYQHATHINFSSLKWAIFIVGQLFERARKKVRESGFQFRKGYSRSKSEKRSNGNNGTESSSDESVKRVKVDKEEREREMLNIKQMLASVEDQIRIKQIRIDKAKTVKDFKLCDQLSENVRSLLREKHEFEKQLAIFQKMEAKSQWYYRSCKKAGAPEKVKAARSGPDLMELFMKKNESKSDQSKQGTIPSNDLQDLTNQHESEKSRQGTETIAESTALSQDLQCTEDDLESVGGDTDILSETSSPDENF